MVSADDGTTIWTLPLSGFMSTQSFFLAGDQIVFFDKGDHLWVDAITGKISRRESIIGDVLVHRRIDTSGLASSLGQSTAWRRQKQSIDLNGKKRAIIQHSNVLAGRYHYFRSYTQPWLGRVDVQSGTVEYLQLPVQLQRTKRSEQLLWTSAEMTANMIAQQIATQRKKPKKLPVQLWAFAPNTMQNSNGHRVMGDNRSQGNGWGHHASAVPTVLGDNVFIPTMPGTVYVIDADHGALNQDAIVAINDLGPSGDSWNRASLSYIDGRIYAHTIKEAICIGQSTN